MMFAASRFFKFAIGCFETSLEKIIVRPAVMFQLSSVVHEVWSRSVRKPSLSRCYSYKLKRILHI